MPISAPSLRFASVLNQGPFPPPALPDSTVLRASPSPHCARILPHGCRLFIPEHALGLPVLRAFPLCTCCRHYPGAAVGSSLLNPPVVSTFPERVTGSVCASTFSRLARRSLALRPAHSRCHQFVTCISRRLQPFRYLHSYSGSFRLEHLPGGTCTHWNTPPFHGAHPERPLVPRSALVCAGSLW